MAKAKRVHELAKELGVQSKEIVERCQQEGVPGITNHMSVVKIGLAESIRGWFHNAEQAEESPQEKASATAVAEPPKAAATGSSKAATGGRSRSRAATGRAAKATAKAKAKAAATARKPEQAGKAETKPAEPEAEGETKPEAESEGPPPMTEARIRAARRAAAQAQQASEAAGAESAAQGEASGAGGQAESASDHAAESVRPAAQTPASSEAEGLGEAALGQEAAAAAADQPEAGAAEVPDEFSPEQAAPVGQVNVPNRPDKIIPAGERVKPKEASLRGPRVVRVEQPDQTPAPRSRRGGGGPSGGGGGGGGGAGESGESVPPGHVPGITRSRGPARGRGAGGPAEEEKPSRSKRRSAAPRRSGRAGESINTGGGKFTEQDLIELDDRLKKSSGFLKSRRSSLRKRGEPRGPNQPNAAEVGGQVEIEEPITIKDLSSTTGIKAADVIKWLFKQGVMATINSAIDTEAAMEICLEYDIELKVKEKQTAEQQIQAEFEAREQVDVRPRPPVVTVLGHVDHGKTSLLDAIRTTDVAAHESGGITQHIGASRVTAIGNEGEEKTVVFLDTPGHEAFTSMRARGANMTDMVVLLVAADDGVMPQTIESINHAKAAGVPVVVALNKIDKPEATDSNIQRIFGQLAEHGLNPTDWGGETEIVKVSAISGQGVTDLMEVLDFQAELLELTADYGGTARGTVMEAEMQPGRGPVARVLVQQGHLSVGDFIVIGRAYGRVRDMTDDKGQSVREAGPATPLEISGIDEVPDAGDQFYITDTLKRAEEVALQYREKEREETLASQNKVTLDTFLAARQGHEKQELRLVLKADVQGSVDVLKSSLAEVGNDEVSVRILHAAVGGVTESDVNLADASEGMIIGFRVSTAAPVRDIAEAKGVEIRNYSVIYDLINDVKSALEGMLAPETSEEILGSAEVRQVFKISKVGSVAGCLVTSGTVQRNTKVRVERDGQIVTQNRELETLRRVKDDVREVKAGTECGIKIGGFDDVKPGDQIVCYRVAEVARKLES